MSVAHGAVGTAVICVHQDKYVYNYVVNGDVVSRRT